MCAARNGSLEVTASGTAPYCAEMHQVCSLLRWEGRCWLHPSLKVKVKSGSNMPGTDAERKARTINTGSKACKKACKLFAVQVVFQRKCKQDAWSLALRFDSCHTGPVTRLVFKGISFQLQRTVQMEAIRHQWSKHSS